MPGPTAFVLGGGGLLGAAEVGMLNALVDADITPDLVLGSSVLSTLIGGQRAFSQSGELCFSLLSAIRSKDGWKCRRISVVVGGRWVDKF